MIRYPLKEGNQLVFNTQQKTNIHGRYFQTTMTTNRLFDYDREDLRTIDNAANDKTEIEYNRKFEMHELETAINDLESDKANGADEIHNGFLLHLGKVKLMDLLGCLNRMWREGKYPKAWKLALIIDAAATRPKDNVVPREDGKMQKEDANKMW